MIDASAPKLDGIFQLRLRTRSPWTLLLAARERSQIELLWFFRFKVRGLGFFTVFS